jgi:hypothetical protein
VGPGCQRRGVKEKRGGEVVDWRGGGLGCLGRKEPVRFFSFFKLHFQIIFHLKFKSNFFKLFSRIFIDFLETTQATKNHASQMMMHIHLLSLSLLNYL